MKTYLVGGAVRDALLGLSVADQDFVVVGGSEQVMLEAGFKQVGRDFPVFLHPKTHQEYALARTEQKISAGYTGFKTQTHAVSLEQDLSRRDLTINAMAQDEDGTIIDPFNGRDDLDNGLLCHISSAFSQDPVRILRVARFGARLKPFGFKVAHNTHRLMQQMTQSGEVDALVPERVWAELYKALSYDTPSAFFKILQACGALAVILPELSNQQLSKHKNAWLFLDTITSKNTAIKWAVLCHQLPLDQLNSLCERINCPKAIKSLAQIACKQWLFVQNFQQQPAEQILVFFNQCDAFRRKDRFIDLLAVFEHLAINTNDIKNIWQSLLDIDIKAMNKKNIAVELPKKRLETILECRKQMCED